MAGQAGFDYCGIAKAQPLSYFTIELKDELIPQEMKGKFDNWMFGCDVCPWNRFSKPNTEQAFSPLPAY